MNSSKKNLKDKEGQACNCSNGWISYTDENGCSVAKECECMKSRKLNSRLAFANIPDAFKDVSLSNFKSSVYKKDESKEDIKIVVGIVKKYLESIDDNIEQGMGLYIYSKTKGSGKTRLAVSLANELIEKYNIQVKFATSPQILNEIRSTWDRNSEYAESTLLDALSTAKVLIIDDFGTEEIRGWINDKYYSIINQRYINKKPTLFTSNEQLEELEYDDRIISRIRERVYQVSFPEEDIRVYIAEARDREMLKNIAANQEANNKFNDFERRNYSHKDYKDIEKKLLRRGSE